MPDGSRNIVCGFFLLLLLQGLGRYYGTTEKKEDRLWNEEIYALIR